VVSDEWWWMSGDDTNQEERECEKISESWIVYIMWVVQIETNNVAVLVRFFKIKGGNIALYGQLHFKTPDILSLCYTFVNQPSTTKFY
jgi:hypothetical protein